MLCIGRIEMFQKVNMFWTVYKKLEKDVLDLSYYIHFTDEKSDDSENKGRTNKINQIWTYSNQIADLLIAISTQIESLFLELYKIEFKETTDTVATTIREINNKWNLSDKKVRIISKNMYFTDVNGFGSAFAPMAYKSNDENDYYSAYCAVKHNRVNALYKANINVLIRALAALFILNVYYSFEKVEVDEIAKYDFSFDSDIFSLEYSLNEYSSSAVLIVEEDKEYVMKLELFADTIPEINNAEFLNFKDETVSPKRYTIIINKGTNTID